MTNEIHGLNSIQIAAMFEALIHNNPNKADATEMAEKFIASERVSQNENGRRMMQEQMDNMSPEEAESFHNSWVA